MPVTSLSSGTLGLRFMQRGSSDSSQKAPQNQKHQQQTKRPQSTSTTGANQNEPNQPSKSEANAQEDAEQQEGQQTVWGKQKIVTVSSYMSMPGIKRSFQGKQSGAVPGRRSFGKFNRELEPKEDEDNDSSSKKPKNSRKINSSAMEDSSNSKRKSPSIESDSEDMHVDDDSSDEEVARSLQQKTTTTTTNRRPRTSSNQEPTSPKKRVKSKHSNSNNSTFMKPSGFGEALPPSKAEMDRYQPDEEFADDMITSARQKKIQGKKGNKTNNNNEDVSGDVNTFLETLDIGARNQRESPFQTEKKSRRKNKKGKS